jgi:hypothetical protein
MASGAAGSANLRNGSLQRKRLAGREPLIVIGLDDPNSAEAAQGQVLIEKGLQNLSVFG